MRIALLEEARVGCSSEIPETLMSESTDAFGIISAESHIS
jgi:hypothetical protein